MLLGDDVCRCVLYPRGFGDDVLDLATFMKAERRRGTQAFVLSVGSRFLLRSVSGAHRYGIAAAEVANKGILERTNRTVLPQDEVVHYVAFYDISYGDIVGVRAEFFRLAVCYRPEHGNTAHFEIEFWENGGTKRQRRDDKTAIELVLADRLRGPERYMRDDGEEVSAMLNSVPLPTQPASELTDPTAEA